jgi:hypothetical protein
LIVDHPWIARALSRDTSRPAVETALEESLMEPGLEPDREPEFLQEQAIILQEAFQGAQHSEGDPKL